MGSMLLPAAIGAGASLIGGVQQLLGQESQSQKQMDFQERMSSTAYQRGVADMEKAGLNPALAYPMGGASSPAGAQATIPNVAGQMTSSATSAMSAMKEMKLLDQQILKAEADASTASAQRQRAWFDVLGPAGKDGYNDPDRSTMMADWTRAWADARARMGDLPEKETMGSIWNYLSGGPWARQNPASVKLIPGGFLEKQFNELSKLKPPGQN